MRLTVEMLAHGLVRRLNADAQAEDVSCDRKGDAFVITAEGVCIDWDVVSDQCFRRMARVVDHVGNESWDAMDGFTGCYVVGLPGFMVQAYLSRPGDADRHDATLTLWVREADYSQVTADMAKAVRKDAAGILRSSCRHQGRYAPDVLLAEAISAADELLPAKLHGIDVRAFLGELVPHLATASLSHLDQTYRAGAVGGGFDRLKAAHDRAVRQRQLDREAARRRAAMVDAFLAGSPVQS